MLKKFAKPALALAPALILALILTVAVSHRAEASPEKVPDPASLARLDDRDAPDVEGETDPFNEGEAKDTPEATPEAAPEGAPENTTEGTPEGVPEAAPEGAPENTTEGTPEGVPEGAPVEYLSCTRTAETATRYFTVYLRLARGLEGPILIESSWDGFPGRLPGYLILRRYSRTEVRCYRYSFDLISY